MPELRSGYFGQRQQLLVPDLPLKGNCTFIVTVLVDGTKYKLSSNKTCSRHLARSGMASTSCDVVYDHTA